MNYMRTNEIHRNWFGLFSISSLKTISSFCEDTGMGSAKNAKYSFCPLNSFISLLSELTQWPTLSAPILSHIRSFSNSSFSWARPGGGQPVKTVSLQSLQPLSLNPPLLPPPSLVYTVYTRDECSTNERTDNCNHVTRANQWEAELVSCDRQHQQSGLFSRDPTSRDSTVLWFCPPDIITCFRIIVENILLAQQVNKDSLKWSRNKKW